LVQELSYGLKVIGKLMLRVSEMAIEALHSRRTPPGMEPVPSDQTKIGRCMPLQICCNSQFGVRNPHAENPAWLEYSERLCDKQFRFVRILEMLEKVFRLYNGAGFVRKRERLPQVQSEVSLSIQVNIDPAGFRLQAAAQVQFQIRANIQPPGFGGPSDVMKVDSHFSHQFAQ
jgi:hypothetical protein